MEDLQAGRTFNGWPSSTNKASDTHPLFSLTLLFTELCVVSDVVMLLTVTVFPCACIQLHRLVSLKYLFDWSCITEHVVSGSLNVYMANLQ